jgi:hypothetical protein
MMKSDHRQSSRSVPPLLISPRIARAVHERVRLGLLSDVPRAFPGPLLTLSALGTLMQSPWPGSSCPGCLRQERKQRQDRGAADFGESLVDVAYVRSESMMGVVVACLRLLNCQFTFMGGLVLLPRGFEAGSSRMPKNQLWRRYARRSSVHETITAAINQLLTTQSPRTRIISFLAWPIMR